MFDTFIEKEIEFDYGHRIPLHKSKCRNIHGHRGKLVITVKGIVNTTKGTEQGMVQDFGDLKEIMMKNIHDAIDHGFIVSIDDEYFPEFNKMFQNGMKIIPVGFVPTAEMLARWCFEILYPLITNQGRELVRVIFYETPTSKAIYQKQGV